MADADATSRTLTGVGAVPRAGLGTVVWYTPDADLELPSPPDPEAVDAEAERERFEDAVATAESQLQAERERTAERIGEEEAQIFDAHAQFLRDPQIREPVESAIDDGLPAEHAVRDGFADAIDQLEDVGGMMAERADDLRDLRDRLLRILLDVEGTTLADLPEGTVLLAERLTPSDTAALDPERVTGLATVTGGRTSHAAIFARSLAIPAVVGVGDALSEVAEGATVAVDGDRGEVVVDPDAETVERVEQQDIPDVRHERVSTTDGRDVEVAANVGTAAELGPAADQGADGVGLFRTEFLFLDRAEPPDEAEQYEAYVEALETFEGERIVVRTLDVGGDKPVPYLDLEVGDNPFLGVRGIRFALGAGADLFETQLRALLRAAATEHGDGLAVMFPLVATVEELESALDAVDDVAAALDEAGADYAVPELGVMIETPAATYVAGDLAERVDFLSIGTNDLTQYMNAAARDDERVADLHEPLCPAVVRAVDRTVTAAHEADAWAGMCGEMAGDPAYTELLVGLGLDELSMSAVTIPAVKEAVESIDTAAARDLADRVLSASTEREIRDHLTDDT